MPNRPDTFWICPAVIAVAASIALSAARAHAADVAATVNDGKIGYVLTEEYWAIWESPDGKTECPSGFNDGPREQFKKLFPDDGTQRSLQQTALAREIEVWFPTSTPESLPFYQ